MLLVTSRYSQPRSCEGLWTRRGLNLPFWTTFIFWLHKDNCEQFNQCSFTMPGSCQDLSQSCIAVLQGSYNTKMYYKKILNTKFMREKSYLRICNFAAEVGQKSINKKNSLRLRKAAQRTSHRLSMCQVNLTKTLFWSFVIIWVLSPIEFCRKLSFVTICLFEFCHNLSVWVLSQFEFCHNLSFGTIWVCKFCQNFSFVTI